MNLTNEKTVTKNTKTCSEKNTVKYGGKAAAVAKAKEAGKIQSGFSEERVSPLKEAENIHIKTAESKPVKKSALAVVDKTAFLRAFKELTAETGTVLSENACLKTAEYYEALVETNRVMNLTGIVEPYEVAEKHMADSLCILPFIDDGNTTETAEKTVTLIDVGTGAGLPGIPIAIAKPNFKVILLDSQKKRCDFLTKTCLNLGLNNTSTVWGRAEDIAHLAEFRETADFAVARAVAPMPVLLEYLAPFVKPGGKIIAMKGSNVAEEIKTATAAARELNTKLIHVNEYTLTTGEKRSLAVWQKTNFVKKKYPRNSGQIKKKPL